MRKLMFLFLLLPGLSLAATNQASITGGYSKTQTVLTIPTAEMTKVPDPAGYGAYPATFYNKTFYTNPTTADLNYEIVKIVGKSSATAVTVLRAQSSTTAKSVPTNTTWNMQLRFATGFATATPTATAVPPTNTFTPTTTVTPTNTVTEVNTPDTSDYSYSKLPKHYLSGIDSLSCLPSGLGGYGTELRNILQNKYGNGGPGLQMFDKNIATAEGVSYTMSSGATMTGDNGAQWLGESNLSWIGQATWFSSGSGSDTFSWNPNVNVDKVRLYYVALAGGGSFNATVAGVTRYLSCSSASTIVRQVDFSPNGGSSAVSVTSVTGHVVLLGAFFWNDNGGVCVSRWGNAGNKMYNFGYTASDMLRQMFALVKPEYVVAVGGTNDSDAGYDLSIISTPVAYLEKEIHRGSPDTKLCLTLPPRLDVSVFPTPVALQATYAGLYEQLAIGGQNGFYLDIGNPHCFGTFANATANGWMYPDGIHISGPGATQIGNYLDSVLREERTHIGTAPPTPSPGRVGDQYVDQSGPGTIYIGICTDSVTCWRQTNP